MTIRLYNKSFLIAIVIIANSCIDSNKKSNNKANSIDTSFIINTKKKQERHSSDYYISIIAKKNEVHSAHIGIAGSKSEIYKAYEGLQNYSTINELFSLLKHDSAAVRVYAYKAIVSKDSSLATKAWNDMKGKNDNVETFVGCSRMKEPIEWAIKY